MKTKYSTLFSFSIVLSIIFTGIILLLLLAKYTGFRVNLKKGISRENTETIVNFKSLGQGFSPVASSIKSPMLIVVGSNREAAGLIATLGYVEIGDEINKKILGVDYKKSFLIAAFQGKAGDSSWEISITDIRKKSGNIVVSVNIHQSITPPPPGEITVGGSAIVHPYDIVLVQKESIDVSRGTKWTMGTTDGKLLAQTQYP
jgi:hypothetical protein